tara:strand:+ start:6277 stop:6468 length:192 start_codon:yes stop_codon:yes gene_type:complete
MGAEVYIAAFIGAAVGLFLKRPGSDKAMADKTREAYESGMVAGRKIAIQMYEAFLDIEQRDTK